MWVTMEWCTDACTLCCSCGHPAVPNPVPTSPPCTGVVGLPRVWIMLVCRRSSETSCPGVVNYRCPVYQPKGGHYPHWLVQRQWNPDSNPHNTQQQLASVSNFVLWGSRPTSVHANSSSWIFGLISRLTPLSALYTDLLPLYGKVMVAFCQCPEFDTCESKWFKPHDISFMNISVITCHQYILCHFEKISCLPSMCTGRCKIQSYLCRKPNPEPSLLVWFVLHPCPQ